MTDETIGRNKRGWYADCHLWTLRNMRSVLVVEDHFDTRTVLVQVLSSWGHEVGSASTAAEGIEAVSKGAFDVILCDIDLPDETGWAMMKKIRAANKTVC